MILDRFVRRFRAWRRPAPPAIPTDRADWAELWNSGGPVPGGSASLLLTLLGSAGAMQVSAISACVRLLAGNVAKLPIHVFRMIGDDRERDRAHPVAELLNSRPNSWQTAFDFRRQMTANVALHGNAYALKRFEGPRVVELIAWPTDRVRVVLDDEFGAPSYELRDLAGRSRTYPRSEIVHLRDLSLDGPTGLSRIQQARQAISLAMAAETFATSFLTNGADAGVALEIDKALTKPQREALIEAWKQAHQGPDRANIPTVLEGGMKLNRPTGTNKDAQLLELRSFQVEDIARLYGVPPHLIGLTEKQTSWGAGVEQMGLGFLTFHLVDWLVLWEAAIKRDLLDQPSDRDVYAEHLVDGLLRADFKTRMDGYGAAIANGILSRNEVRRKENLAPYAEGDRFLYPTNLAVAGADRSAADGEDAPTMPADRPASAWRKHLFKVERSIRGRSVANE